jgi:hypothetical protein
MPFLKGVTLSKVIFATFNYKYVSVIIYVIDCIFFTYSTSVTFFWGVKPMFFFFHDCVIPYMQLWKDVTITPHLWAMVCKLLPISIINFREASFQFPFFFMVFHCCKLDRVVGSSLLLATPFVQLDILCIGCSQATTTFPCLCVEFDFKYVNFDGAFSS